MKFPDVLCNDWLLFSRLAFVLRNSLKSSFIEPDRFIGIVIQPHPISQCLCQF